MVRSPDESGIAIFVLEVYVGLGSGEKLACLEVPFVRSQHERRKAMSVLEVYVGLA